MNQKSSWFKTEKRKDETIVDESKCIFDGWSDCKDEKSGFENKNYLKKIRKLWFENKKNTLLNLKFPKILQKKENFSKLTEEFCKVDQKDNKTVIKSSKNIHGNNNTEFKN